MIDFHSGEIKDIMPVNLRTPQALAISYAVGQAMVRFRKYLKALPLYAQISQVPEEILDLMAVECGTQYYSQAFPRNVKEKLIIQALTWYMHAGTPSVLSEFLDTVLMGGWIEEWMDYDGKPYHFKAYARVDEETEILPGYETEIRRQLEIYKNVRSYLESFAIVLSTYIPVPVEEESRLEIISDFYSRNNRRLLLLDGTWFLDGSYRLNGYRTAELDLYPAALEMFSAWKTNLYTSSQNSHVSIIAEDIQLMSRGICLLSEIEHPLEEESILSLEDQVNVASGTGGHLRVEHDLWYLDGTYFLDGTKYLDAEIFEYNLDL